MINNALRWLSKLDRSYFFALSAFISTIVVSVTLTFAPVATIQYIDGTTESVSLIERDGGIIVILLLLPILVVGTPLISLPQRSAPIMRSHKVNGSAGTVVLLGFVAISLPSFGLFYVPALIFSVASTVSLFIGRKRTNAIEMAQQQRNAANPNNANGDGAIRMSRSARRRAREQERLEREGGEAPAEPTPLQSARRRRGKRRRKS